MIEKNKDKSVAKEAGLLGAIGLVVLKFKVAIFAALKAIPFLKLGWLLKGGMSMFLSFGIYAGFYGWRWAVAFIGLIFIHEMGHFLSMQAYGLKPKAPVFVPFVGAYTAMTRLPEDLATHAWVAMAGPFVGGLGALACYFLGLKSGNGFLVAAANTGFILNLLQLVPIRPFDGGFIAESIGRWLCIPGAILLFSAALYFHSFFLIIIAFFSAGAAFRKLKGEGPADRRAAPSAVQKLAISLSFVLLAAALAYCYFASYGHAHALMRMV